MSVISAANDGALAYVVKPVLDKIFTEQDRSMLKLLPFVVVGLYLTKTLLRFALNYTLRYMGQKAVERIRNELYSKIIYLSDKFFTASSTGTLMSHITNDVNMMQGAIPVVVSIIRDVLSVVGLVGVIFYMNWKLALIAILLYPLFFHPFVLISKRIRRYSTKIQEEMGGLTTRLQETFTGIRVVKAFTGEERETAKFTDINAKMVDYSLKATLSSEAASPMMELVGAIGLACMLGIGGAQVIDGKITTGDFFAFLTAVVMVYEPVKRLGSSNATVQQALAAAERVFALLSQKAEVAEAAEAAPCSAAGKDVEFKDVSFTYDGEKTVLNSVNLLLRRGTTTALVGPSGTGKSTFANLLPRFYDVTAGAILIGGEDIRRFTLKSLRDNMGYVFQDPFLFNDTVKANIAYQDGEPNMAKIEAACRGANAHDFIVQLPNGYDTVVGERGVLLSGGQKQRLTIARALYKDPPILILDEATSSLDTESEREVQKALEFLMKGRTSVVIAHRLSTIIGADMIVVLEEGRVKAAGKHGELLKTSPLYASLYEKQAAGGQRGT